MEDMWKEFDKLYKKLSKRYHPDLPENKNKELCNEVMIFLNKLYEETRRIYYE